MDGGLTMDGEWWLEDGGWILDQVVSGRIVGRWLMEDGWRVRVDGE